MAGMRRYYGCRSFNERRELQASSTAEALMMLQPGEILQGEHTPPLDQQIRDAARAVVSFRNLHRSAMARIAQRRAQGSLTGRSLVLALSEAAAYRRVLAAQKRALERAMHRAAPLSCTEATCPECRQGAA